jgi:hypothetical protein
LSSAANRDAVPIKLATPAANNHPYFVKLSPLFLVLACSPASCRKTSRRYQDIRRGPVERDMPHGISAAGGVKSLAQASRGLYFAGLKL